MAFPPIPWDKGKGQPSPSSSPCKGEASHTPQPIPPIQSRKPIVHRTCIGVRLAKEGRDISKLLSFTLDPIGSIRLRRNRGTIMKLKNLRKKIQRLEKRLQEAPKKLARLKQRLQAAEAAKAMKAARKSAARATAARLGCDETEQRQETEEKTESLARTSRAAFSRNESQVGCQARSPGKRAIRLGGSRFCAATTAAAAGKPTRRRLSV